MKSTASAEADKVSTPEGGAGTHRWAQNYRWGGSTEAQYRAHLRLRLHQNEKNTLLATLHHQKNRCRVASNSGMLPGQLKGPETDPVRGTVLKEDGSVKLEPTLREALSQPAAAK